MASLTPARSVGCNGGRSRAILARRSTYLWLAALLALCQPLTTAVIVVENDCTLVDAITAANTDSQVGGCPAGDPGEDVIELTENVILTEVDNDSRGPTGLPLIETAVTLEGNGFRIQRADGSPAFRIFHATGAAAALALNDTIVGNGAAANWCGGGIATYWESTLVLRGSTVSHNSANCGGGILAYGSTYVIDSTVSANVAGDDGGGILVGLFDTLVMVNSTVSGNSSGDSGGGLYLDGDATLTNSTISGNSAGLFGGGFTARGRTTLTNSTMSGNSAGYFGGNIFNYEASTSLKNSIVVLGDVGCSGNGIGDEGGNFTDLGSGCPGARIRPRDIDAALADNGGATRTHALLAGSVAIDAAGACGLETDQRGFGRIDGSCDSGSYEYGSSPPFSLIVTGSCPGLVMMVISEASPSQPVVVAWSSSQGTGNVPGGPCAGTELRLDSPQVLLRGVAGADGGAVIHRKAPPGACGAWIQALDVATCDVSNVTQIP